MTQEIRRILVVRTDRIGDVLLTLPMAHHLRQQFPSARIGMLIRRYTADLVDDNENIDEILFYDDGNRPLPFFQLVAILRAGRYDVVFHTYPRFHLALVTWFARIPIRVGTGYRWYSFLFNRKVYEHRKYAVRHELEYNLNLLSAFGSPPPNRAVVPTLTVKEETLGKVSSLLAARGVQKGERFVILHPGSGKSARDWSARNFGALGRKLAQERKVKIVITGVKKEQSLIDEVRSVAGNNPATFIDELNLKELAALAKLSSLVVGNSTGPLHIAAAVGTPVVGLYPQVTALNAVRWGPYTQKKTILSPENKPADCNLCVRRKNSICDCMESISVEQVYEAAAEYLSKS